MDMEEMLRSLGKSKNKKEAPSGIADNNERQNIRYNNLDFLEDTPFGEINNPMQDPRSSESRRFGLYWVNKKIDKLISSADADSNASFVEDLRTLLTMNPLRDGKDKEFNYAYKIYANPLISKENREKAVQLLSMYDFNLNYNISEYENIATMAIKNGDIGALTAMAQSSNNDEYGNPLNFIDTNGNNVLHVAASNNPKLIPFLLRSGVKNTINNSNVDASDIALKTFISKVNFKPKEAFDDLYITISALAKYGQLDVEFFKKNADVLKDLNPKYIDSFKSMSSKVFEIIQSDNVAVPLPAFSTYSTNIGNGYSTLGAAAPTGGLIADKFNMSVQSSQSIAKHTLEASRSFIDSFDSETWLNSSFNLKKKGFFKSFFGPRNEVERQSEAGYINLHESKLTDIDLYLNNKKVIQDKLMSNLENINDKNNPTAIFYESILKKIKDLDSSNELDVAKPKLLDNIKNELLSFRTNIALDHMSKVIEEGKLSLQHIDLSTKFNNKDGDTLLTYAVKTNNNKLLNFVLENNTNLNELNGRGDGVLHIAAASGNLEIINKLIGRFEKNQYVPYPPAKSVADLMLLNSEGKTFIDVMRESLPSETFKQKMSELKAQQPQLKDLLDKLSWDIPYWSLDSAESEYLNKLTNEEVDKPLIGMNNPKLLTDAEWYKKPYPLGSAYTESEANEHFKELNDTIKNITHALRSDNLDKDTARDMREALSNHLDHLPADKLLGMTIAYMSSADKDREELHKINMDLMNPSLSPQEKNDLTRSKNAVNDYMSLKSDIIEKVSNSVITQLAEGSESRKESIYQAFDKYARETGSDVTKVLAGMSVLTTENEQHHRIFVNLEERVNNITAQKYADMTRAFESDSNFEPPSRPNT